MRAALLACLALSAAAQSFTYYNTTTTCQGTTTLAPQVCAQCVSGRIEFGSWCKSLLINP